MEKNNISYTVKEVIYETNDVVTLKLTCDEEINSQKAGQFITVFFPETGHMEGKSYSISSAPHEEYVSLTVKGVGVFSNKLLSMNRGDIILGSPPYGYFFTEEEGSSLIFIAGGIGVVPFRSMIVEILQKYPTRKMYLFYSSKTVLDGIFKIEFDKLVKKHEGSFFVRYYLTQEKDEEGWNNGRIPIRDIIESSSNLPDREFFICGSISFVRDYWRGLKDAGIKEECLYTEAFF